ncbi:MAG: SEL1-like repeat protein [Planctomycetota bacterium]|jgi:TPR repeat protein|nr:SEL1-like repeat protein [Planctomycetota bacterium]
MFVEKGKARGKSSFLIFIVALVFSSGVLLSAENNVEAIYERAEKGDAEAQYQLAVAYAEGKGIEKDDREALEWARKAAEQGNANAMYLASKLDPSKREKWLLMAAERGLADAQREYGNMYDSQNREQWLRKAAEQGHLRAKYDLARYLSIENGQYNRERNREREEETAKLFVELLRQADAGNKNIEEFANRYTFIAYLTGEGLGNYLGEIGKRYLGNYYAEKHDIYNAIEYWKKAADGYNPDPEAMYRIGLCYLKGVGVPQNKLEARKWLKRAAEAGVDSAKKTLEEMK